MTSVLKKINDKHIVFFLGALLTLEFLWLMELPFFWDAISKSVRASWIYKNGLSQVIVPTEYNSGHPPLWIWLLATFWTITEKALWSSRVLLLLVNIGIVFQIVAFCKINFVKGVAIYAVLLVCLEPTFIAQTTSLNNDMLLLFFTLLGLNALTKSKPLLFTLALVGLLLTNLRGTYIVIALAIIHYIYIRFQCIENKKPMRLAYIIGIVIFAVFCYLQYRKLGWFIISQNEGYNVHRQSAGLKQVLINIVVYFKSFFNYGRFIVVMFLFPLVIKYLKDRKNRNTEIDRVGIAFLVFAVIFFVGMVPFSNPFGDRYFMICYLLSLVLLINLWTYYKIAKKQILYITTIVMLISGHFWIYPATLSQSWDSSLAYLNSYKVEKRMESFIDSVGIEPSEIGTRIRLNQRKYSEFKSIQDDKLYADFDLKKNEYVLLSNIENNTKDEELNQVMKHWILVKRYSQLGVFMALYKKD